MNINTIKNHNHQQQNFKATYKIHIPGTQLMTRFEAIEGLGSCGRDKFLKAFYKAMGTEGESVQEIQNKLPDPIKMFFEEKPLSEIKNALKQPRYITWLLKAPSGDSDFYFLTSTGEQSDKLLSNFSKLFADMKKGKIDYFQAIKSMFKEIRGNVDKTFNINSLDELPAVVEKLK